MSNLAPYADSRIIGDLDLADLADLIGDDDLEGDDDLADLIGELGRSRGRRRRIGRRATRHGGLSREQAGALRAQLRSAQLRAINQEAMATGEPQTAGRFVADGGSRNLYIPFDATVTLNNTLGQVATLRTRVQRPMVLERIILEAVDNTNAADVLGSVGVTGILSGVNPLFNAQGVAPARAFAYNAVGVKLLSMVSQVGQDITVQMQRIVGLANGSVISGFIHGTSAE